MSRYFFDIKNEHRLIDPAGLDCTGDDDAIAKAKVIAIQIAQETSGSEGQRNIAVMDNERREVAQVPVHVSLERAAE